MKVTPQPAVFWLTTASAASVMVSIAVAQILLVAAVLLWILTRRTRLRVPGYFLPAGVLLAITLISLAFSPAPGAGLATVYKFWLFSMGLVVANSIVTAPQARVVQRFILAAGAAGALVAIVQFAIRYVRFESTGLLADDPTVLSRVTGTMGHWMTFSGVQLLAWCAAVPALAVLGRRWIVPTAIIGFAILLSFTRSAWLGSAAGLASTAFSLPRRVLLALMIPIVVVGIASSSLIYHRIAMSFEGNFAPDYARAAYVTTGLHMIQDHPFFGVGPNQIGAQFPVYYEGDNLSKFYYGHLHNNFVQIAAERGLFALAALIWFFAELYRGLFRAVKSDPLARPVALSGIAALTGFLVAGLFEFNFGDSEVLMLLICLVSLPCGIAGRAAEDRRTPVQPIMPAVAGVDR